MNLKELIEQKKIQIEFNQSCIKEDLRSFAKPSPQRERLQKLLMDVRTRKDAKLRQELDVLQAADDALCSIALMVEGLSDQEHRAEWDAIMEAAKKPYVKEKEIGNARK